MKIILTILLAFYCTGLYAENTVDIFDQNRGQEKKAEPDKKISPRKKRTTSKGAEFSLSGISKMDDKYVFYFDTLKGKQDSFSWIEDQKSTPIIIYNNYEIDKIIDRTLYLKIINNKPCVEDQKKGISCDNKNQQMVMQLMRKKATVKPPSARKRRKPVKKPQTGKRPESPFKRSKKVKK